MIYLSRWNWCGVFFVCVQAAQPSGCLLAVLALTAKEMIEGAISATKSGAYIVVRLGSFFLVGFFFPSCPNSKETLGGKQAYKQGADKKCFHEESDCRCVGVRMPIVCESQRKPRQKSRQPEVCCCSCAWSVFTWTVKLRNSGIQVRLSSLCETQMLWRWWGMGRN